MKKRNIVLGLLVAGLSFTSVFAATAKANNVITMEKAKAIASAKVPGGTITSIELDREASRTVYEIEIHLNDYEYDLKLDAVTGKGISIHKEYDKDYDKSDAQQNLAGSSTVGSASKVLTQSEVEAIALKEVSGATIKKIELDHEDGKAVYEVELRKASVEYDVEIDAVTGAVLKCKIDD